MFIETRLGDLSGKLKILQQLSLGGMQQLDR